MSRLWNQNLVKNTVTIILFIITGSDGLPFSMIKCMRSLNPKPVLDGV